MEEERINVANERERTYAENNLRRLEDLVCCQLIFFPEWLPPQKKIHQSN